MEYGETNLETLIRGMRPKLDPHVFVFVHQSFSAPTPKKLAAEAMMAFKEKEGWTYILKQATASELGLDHIFLSRMITLEVHSSLEAVGFLACIIPALAELEIGVNPVAGYFHDHLFVPVDKADKALTRLIELTKTN